LVNGLISTLAFLFECNNLLIDRPCSTYI